MTAIELDSAPNLTSLYGKAALSGLRPGPGSGADAGDRLPADEVVRHEVVADPDHLAGYNEVCGFTLSDELPSTFLHVLAFPLQITLMTRRDFPFGLLGLVHVANTITQRRPMRLTESFTLRVWAQHLRPHEKGQQFDVISEIVPTGQDEAVWTDVSTYLRRGGGSGSDGEKKASLTPPAPKAIWQVPADIGRRYAEVSGDRNPIHLYAATAKLFGFPKAIAHGMWTKAHSLAAFEGKLPDAYELAVRFKRPILLPAKVAFTSWATDSGYAFEAWHARKPQPHLDGTITGL